MIFWSEVSSHCIRQGIPLHNDSVHSPFSPSITPMELSDMVLNVSTFAGICGGGNGGFSGPVFNRSGVLDGPRGIALVVVPSNDVRSVAVLLIGDYNNRRLAMITPMYPSSARYLTAVFNGNDVDFIRGVTIGRVGLLRGGSTAVVDVVVGTVELDSTSTSPSSLDATRQPAMRKLCVW